jgi:uncharacterized protein YjbJ (UPF0337 family)
MVRSGDRSALARGLLRVLQDRPIAGSQREEHFMDSDRIEGPLKEAGGKVKEEWGDATDNERTEAEGQADQVEGKLQNEWGETKDEVRDATDGDR